MPPIITLLTDFGLRDSYVGTLKGVLLGICPAARIVDISHAIRARNVREAAFVLACAAPYFPPHTIHTVVVDPGVGGPRRAIAVRTRRHAVYVAPDNGVLTPALQNDEPDTIIHLCNPDYWRPEPGATFHGRDVFAPVAAHLALGAPLESFGPRLDAIVTLETHTPARLPDGTLEGAVQYVDHFGNAVTNIPAAGLPAHAPAHVRVEARPIGRVNRTYADVNPGEPVALIGSHGFLEIAVRDGNAAQTLGLDVGAVVRVGQ
ncbi:MAG: SAM-dependent chlorinase/fluorinase [Kiritimatiellae bacterium]|nr:SAM-dependent chlorinase/fluorinase [Kiritimatiellia bacterium]